MTRRRISYARSVSMDANWLNAVRYLCVESNGRTRLTTEAPALGPSEIAIRFEIKLPRAIFRRPQLTAKIEVPLDQVTPASINALDVKGIGKAIKDATGLHAHIAVVPPEEK